MLRMGTQGDTGWAGMIGAWVKEWDRLAVEMNARVASMLSHH